MRIHTPPVKRIEVPLDSALAEINQQLRLIVEAIVGRLRRGGAGAAVLDELGTDAF